MLYHCIVNTLFCVLLSMWSSRHQAPQTEAALSKLDQLLNEEEFITEVKEARINVLRTQLFETDSDNTRYSLMKKLYYEFERYNLDSAFYYAHQKEDLARRIGDQALINDALVDIANRYIISGMYRYAENALNSVIMDESSSPIARTAFFRSIISLHHGLKLTNRDPVFNERLDMLEHKYRDMIFTAADSTMMYYYTYRAENEMDRGHPEIAREELSRYFSMNPTSPDELSILNYCMAKTFRMEGDEDKALAHYATSAYYDLSEGVRSSRSLIKTALLAMEKGQTSRAFSYITRAYDDATVSDARICLEEISRFMPDVISSYDQISNRRYKDAQIIVILLTVILAISLTALYFIRRYQSQILRQMSQIKEANELRETTLGNYVAMFTSHINSLEEYRSSIRVVAKSRDLDQITHVLRSDDFIDAKRSTLLKEFDHTFLSVFPDFVQELNALLKPGHHVGEDLPAGKLSNELRIFALIRLGVNESAAIARFLKKSPSTIYNYRVKLRNASIYPNEEFEKHLLEIGKM